MTKKRRLTHSQDAFRAAVSVYRDRTLSSVDASRKFGGPESTIWKHKNKTKNRIGSGHSFLLTKEQEEYLVALLRELESIGIRLTKEILSKVCGDFIGTVSKKIRETISKCILFL